MTGGSDRFAQRSLDVDARAAIPEVLLKSATSYPLIYRKRVARVSSKAKPGDLVALYAPGADGGEERLVGYGCFNPKSEILVRVLRRDLPPDGAYFDALLGRAASLRRDLLRLDEATDAYRVVHAESDGLSGLVIDRFADVLSAEAFSLGTYLRGRAILERLQSMLGTRHLLLRPSPHFLAQEGFDPQPVASDGLPPQVVVREHGTRFRVRFEGGHKTGFFCDQRDNRRMLASFSRDKSVLDLCCYSGGFAVQAKKLGGAREVTAVDLDETPLALARENANLNQVRVDFVQADAFTYLRDRISRGRRYDVVVLDPPKLIRSRDEIEDGRKKYFDLNRLAMQVVAEGGLLLTCSCSGLMPEDEFLDLVLHASRQAGAEIAGETTRTGRPKHAARSVQILARTGAAPDHPVSPHVPETRYLKAVWLRME